MDPTKPILGRFEIKQTFTKIPATILINDHLIDRLSFRQLCINTPDLRLTKKFPTAS